MSLSASLLGFPLSSLYIGYSFSQSSYKVSLKASRSPGKYLWSELSQVTDTFFFLQLTIFEVLNNEFCSINSKTAAGQETEDPVSVLIFCTLVIFNVVVRV